MRERTATSRVFVLSSVLILVSVLAVRWYFHTHPVITEWLYSNTIFPIIRWLLNHSFGMLPFSTIYLLGFVLMIYAIYLFIKKFRFHWINALEWSLGLILMIISFFYILWGYNYSRLSISTLMDLKEVEVDSAYVRAEIERTLQILVESEKDIEINQIFSRLNSDSKKYVPDLEDGVRSFLGEYQVTMSGPVPVRFVNPKGLLLGFGASGVYFPLSGEANVDPGLPLLLQPFVIAHELSHAYGITDEGSCNFIAFLVCIKSDNPVIRYSGNIQYLRYLLGNFRRNFPKGYLTLWNDLPPVIRERLRQIRSELDRYPEFLPTLRPIIYDRYLKTQGISEGMANYSKLIQLWAGYQHKMDQSSNFGIRKADSN